MTAKMNEQKRNFLILMLICVVTILPFLGAADYYSKGEPREAVVAYSMLETGNWVLPTNYGGDIAFKPPFFHWSIAVVSSLFGGVSEGSSRLPSALALIVMALALYAFYARRKDAWTALLAVCVTLTCFEVHRAGFACRVDMVLTAFIVLALLQFYRWCEHNQKGVPWLAVLFMGCAVLTKGPVGIILPCFVTGVFLWIRDGKFWQPCWKLAGIALLACVIPGVWYALAYRQGGDAFLDLMMEENFGRFLGKMSYESHENPVSYNFIMLFAGWLPWTLLVLFSLFSWRYRKPEGRLREAAARTWTAFRRWNDVDLFSFLSIVLIFLFYCIPASKRSVYLLPIYPFIGYFLAVYFRVLLQKGKRSVAAFGVFMTAAMALLTLTFVALQCGWVPDTVFSGKRAAENIAFLHALGGISWHIGVLCLVLLPIAATCCFWRLRKRGADDGRQLLALCGILFTLFMALDGLYQPAVLGVKSDKPLAAKVKEWAPEGAVYSYGPAYFYGVNFYNGNRMAFFERSQPQEGVLLVGERREKELLENYGNDYEFTEIYRSALRSCDIRDIVVAFRFRKKQLPGL